MKLLVTGREGQVVRSLIERAALRSGVEIAAVGRPQLDLADPPSIERAIAAAGADIVVSAAAYTNVDQAEDEPDLAHLVNSAGAGAVAAAAARHGAAVIHLSTDYVFSGKGDSPHTEAEEADPGTVYGASKLAGERAVAAANPRHVILRTAWVYSPFGRNFVKTILRFAGEHDTLQVVSDQFGNPTSALDLADGILDIAAAVTGGSAGFGTFHLAGTDSTSWYGFAGHILAASAALGGPWASAVPIPTSAYPTRARRPANARLSCDKLAADYGIRLPAWQDSCTSVVSRILSGDPA